MTHTTESSLLSFNRFVALPKQKNLWIEHPEFEKFYARIVKRREDCFRDWWFDIANVTVRKPGNGTMTRLIKQLHEGTKWHPAYHIYVENIMFTRFEKKLERLGFTRVSGLLPSFYLLKTDRLILETTNESR